MCIFFILLSTIHSITSSNRRNCWCDFFILFFCVCVCVLPVDESLNDADMMDLFSDVHGEVQDGRESGQHQEVAKCVDALAV